MSDLTRDEILSVRALANSSSFEGTDVPLFGVSIRKLCDAALQGIGEERAPEHGFRIRVEDGALDARGSLARVAEALEDLGAELVFREGELTIRRRRREEPAKASCESYVTMRGAARVKACDRCDETWTPGTCPPCCRPVGP